MTATPEGSFACPHCGRRFAWEPELAGRPIRCKCDFTFRAPDEAGGVVGLIGSDATGEAIADAAAAVEVPADAAAEPAPPADSDAHDPADPTDDADPTELEEDNTYALNLPDETTGSAPAVEPAKCPNCNQRITPGAVLCVKCGFDLKGGRKMRTEVATDAPAAAATGAAAGPTGAVGGAGAAGVERPPAPPPADAESAPAISPGSTRDPRLALERIDDMPTAGALATADESRRKHRIDLVLPGVLIVLGVGATFLRYFHLTPELGAGASLLGAIASTVLTLVLLVPVALMGMLFAVRLLGVAFGTLGLAMYKLVGLVLMAATIVSLASYVIPGFVPGFFLGLLVAHALSCALAVVLFELDFGEAVLIVTIIIVLGVIAMVVGLFALMAGLRAIV